MALTEAITYDCELRGDNHIQVRQITTISRDGKKISTAMARYVMCPDSDLDAKIPQFGDAAIPANIKAICQAQFTDDIKTAWSTNPANSNSENFPG